MDESILTSIKKLLGISEDYEHFDPDIIMHINSTLMILTQLGVGPEEGFSISDKETTWMEFIGEDNRLNLISSYVFMRVKMMFDPPLSSVVMDAMNRMVNEYEWRLNVSAESIEKEVPVDG